MPPSLNTVETVFSADSVKALEYTIQDYWNNTDWDNFTDKIMMLLSVYIEHCPKDVHQLRRPNYMCGFISDLVKLNEQLVKIIHEDRVGEWIDVPDGWERPS